MKRYAEKLETLKDKLRNENEFSKTFQFFFDRVSRDADFMGAGKKVKYAHMKNLLKAVCEELFDETPAITGLFVIRLRRDRFYHGSCFLNGRMTAFFYFEEIDMGMVAVTISLSGLMKYARITSTPIGPDKAIILPDPNKPPTIH